jgi:hypothetical protein
VMGIWGIVLPALIMLLLFVTITIAVFAKARPASELAPVVATKLYADTLAAELKVPRLERRYIPHIIDGVSEIRGNGTLADLETSALLGHPQHAKEHLRGIEEAAHAAFTISQWWDGSAQTEASPPLLAQIVAVAEAWSALTAQSGPELSHEEALGELQSWAGTRYDPKVIDAAGSVVRRERRLTSQPAL